jgi:hypothetical protein
MSFNIERASENRSIRADVPDLEGQDDINLFKQDPSRFVEPELGMDFLVGPEEEQDEQEDFEEEIESEQENFFDKPSNDNEPEAPQMSYEDMQQQKSYYLSQLKRLEKKGNVLTRRFTMQHSLDELRSEAIRIKKEIAIDGSIDYMRQGLMFAVSTLEMVDGRYNFGMDLGGWSQTILPTIENYDSVFEELYDKYANSVSVGPEIKLISMLAGSAFMFSLQKKMVGGVPPRQREMAGPSMDTDELMKSLGELDIDDMSSVSSSGDSSVVITTEEPTKVVNIKKGRGRPKKNL